jgi:hypothetical protein
MTSCSSSFWAREPAEKKFGGHLGSRGAKFWGDIDKRGGG